MKKVLSLLVLSLLFVSLTVISVSASENPVTLKVESNVVNNNIVMKASLNDITDPTGLAVIEYYIQFDHTVLELVNVNVNIPDKWKDLIDDELAEDFSHKAGDGVYFWAWVLSQKGYGITEDNQLFIELEFKVLKETETTVHFSHGIVGNDDLLEPLNGNSVDVKLNTANPENPEFDNDASAIYPDVSGPLFDPNINVETGNSVDFSDENSESSVPDEKGDTTLIIVLASVGGVLIIGLVIFIIKGKKVK